MRCPTIVKRDRCTFGTGPSFAFFPFTAGPNFLNICYRSMSQRGHCHVSHPTNPNPYLSTNGCGSEHTSCRVKGAFVAGLLCRPCVAVLPEALCHMHDGPPQPPPDRGLVVPMSTSSAHVMRCTGVLVCGLSRVVCGWQVLLTSLTEIDGKYVVLMDRSVDEKSTGRIYLVGRKIHYS